MVCLFSWSEVVWKADSIMSFCSLIDKHRKIVISLSLSDTERLVPAYVLDSLLCF